MRLIQAQINDEQKPFIENSGEKYSKLLEPHSLFRLSVLIAFIYFTRFTGLDLPYGTKFSGLKTAFFHGY